ncbi:hypothetical protein AB6O49_10235 [Streptomyces sp. SBR177]
MPSEPLGPRLAPFRSTRSGPERLAYEVAALAFARIEAYEEPGSVIVWHEQYDRFITRMTAALGKAADDCRMGKHDRRPARFALASWPALVSSP